MIATTIDLLAEHSRICVSRRCPHRQRLFVVRGTTGPREDLTPKECSTENTRGQRTAWSSHLLSAPEGRNLCRATTILVHELRQERHLHACSDLPASSAPRNNRFAPKS